VAKLNITIPNQDPDHVLSVGQDFRSIQSWMEGLPTANAEATLKEFMPVLIEMNRTDMGLDLRFRVMQMFEPLVDGFIEQVRQEYLNMPFPLEEKIYAKSSEVKNLLREMAYGYKIIFNQYIVRKRGLSKENVILCLVHAIDYMARLILRYYLLYEQVPPKVWRELNSLFNFTQDLGIHNQEVIMKNKGPCTVERGYMRVMLLAAIKPYRLMRGEAEKVYHQMGRWSHHCILEHPTLQWEPVNELVIDLSTDWPPYHVDSNSRFSDLSDIRILNIEVLKKIILDEAESVTKHVANKNVLALTKRQTKEMLTRLVSGWKSKHDRQDGRINFIRDIEVALGMMDCFSIFSEDGDTIKGNEIDQGNKGALSDLSLLSKDDTGGGYSTGKASTFNIQNPGNDVWDKSTVLPTDGNKDADNKEIKTYQLIQVDKSPGGIGAAYDKSSGLHPRVGELMCYRDRKDFVSEWKLGKISWLTMDHAGPGGFGVRALGKSVKTLFVKALRGTGEGGDYMRALLVPADGLEKSKGLLVVPSAIYDLDTVLVTKEYSKSKNLRLSELKFSSESVACFAVEVK
jgi:hypothetical protein